MPSFRAKLARTFEHIQHEGGIPEGLNLTEFLGYFPEIPRDLVLVLELVLPMGTHYEPLPESKHLLEMRKQARQMSIEKTYELTEAEGSIDIRKCSSNEIYNKLSPEIRAFFDRFPMDSVEDKPLRVTKALSSWKFYMGEVLVEVCVCSCVYTCGQIDRICFVGVL